MKRLILILPLLLSLTGISKPKPESAVVDLSIFYSTDPGHEFKTLIIPIKRVQNLILIEARLDSMVGNFILDTGSPHLVLNKTYFRQGWKLYDKMAAHAGGVSTSPVMRTRVNNLAIKELFFEKLTADLSNLGHIENHRGIKILGLLGVSLFTDFEMVIDLHKDVMYLHKLDKNGLILAGEKLVKSQPIIKIPFKLIQNIITVEVIVYGKKLTLCLDTGAETNTLSNQLPDKVLESFTVSKRMVLLGTNGARTEVLLGIINEITVGTKSFKNMHAAITGLEDLGQAYGRSIDGMLGSSFLVKGIISINFATKELCMYPFEVNEP